MTKGKILLGIFLIGIGVVGMLRWEDKTEVLVLKDNVERGTRITEEMLTARELEPDADYIPLEDKEKIIGKETTGYVHQGMPLFEEYFRDGELTPNEKENRYGMCIPAGWIASGPAGLSRGDRVFFYQGREEMVSAPVSAVGEDFVEIIVTKEQAGILCEIAADGEQLVIIYQ